MHALFEAIREVCSPQIWSRGVELSRTGAVIGDPDTGAEMVLNVASQDGMAYATVTLWPEETDWICDCTSGEDACAHVAAAVIALRHARRAGTALPAPRRLPGRLGYRLTRTGRSLALTRVVVRDDATTPLESSLSALESGRVAGPTVIITEADRAVERVLGSRPHGHIPRDMMPKLLSALARCSDVRLDELPVHISTSPVLPRATLVDHGHGFLLRLEPDPNLTEMFTNGAACCGDTLRPVGESGFTARERETLPNGRFFPLDDVAELVTEVLPSLQKRVPVQVRSQRLPDLTNVPPRIVIEAQGDGDTLEVEPTLVYGDPPLARLENGRLRHLHGAVPLRQAAAERRLIRQLEIELGLGLDRKTQFRGETAVRFVQRLQTWQGEIRGHGHEPFILSAALVPRIRPDTDHFELSFETSGTDAVPGSPGQRLDAATVLRAWQDGAAVLPLPGSGWAPVPVDWLERFGHHVADLLAARDPGGRLPTCVLPDLARLCDALAQPRPAAVARLQTLVEDFRNIPEAVLPPEVRATLRPYQRRGVDWLVFLRQAGLGALLADDMGLGKTVQTLCAIHGRTLVVTPTSVLSNWAHEMRRFRPGLAFAMYHGPHRQLDLRADVILTTYAILRLDTDVLAQTAWDTVVLDEAQTIKNPDSQVAEAAYRLQAPFRVALSGTPVENRLDELWSQMHFLNPGLLGSRRDFQTRYGRPIAAGQPGAAARLRERIRPFVLRRRKQDVAADLPPRTDMVLHCGLDDTERRVYDAIRAATREQVVARLQAGGSVLEALEALLRLRQACCHAGLVPGQRAASSSKIDVLLEALDQVVAEDHKALVFSQWTALLDRVEPHLQAAGIDFVRLDGTTRNRADVVRRFQTDDGPPVMLISLRAGGLGLNLTAADHVFLLDPWWNPAVEDQAADRAHRLGQNRPVLVYRLVAEATVEERILLLQEHKRALADVALGGAEAAAALTRDDLLALLE